MNSSDGLKFLGAFWMGVHCSWALAGILGKCSSLKRASCSLLRQVYVFVLFVIFGAPGIHTFWGIHPGTLLVTFWAQSAKKLSKWGLSASICVTFWGYAEQVRIEVTLQPNLCFQGLGGRYWHFLATSFHVIFRLLLGGPGRGVPVDLGRFWSNLWVPFGGTFGSKASPGTENSVPFAQCGSRDGAGVDFW